MVDPIAIALMQVGHAIPYEILEAVFEPTKRQLSLDYCIYNDVILKRVLPDANIAGGQITSIQLSTDMLEETRYENFNAFGDIPVYALYRIPPERRENKKITLAISVSYPYLGYGNPYGTTVGMGMESGCGSGQNMTNLACQGLMASTGRIIDSPRPVPILRAGDLIELTPSLGIPLSGFNWLLTCRLEHDKEFTNLNVSAVEILRKLVEYAAKSHVYNTAILKIDKFYVTGGVEWGRFKEVVDSYADADEKYEEKRLEFHDANIKLSEEFRRKVLYMQV